MENEQKKKGKEQRGNKMEVQMNEEERQGVMKKLD